MGNSLNIDLKNKYVVLKGGREYYKGSDVQRVFFCEGCFGVYSFTIGNAIFGYFGYFVYDGEKCKVERYAVERFATDKEVEEAKKLKGGK